MNSKVDIVEVIGKGVCNATDVATQFLADQPACTHNQVWNMGALAIAAALVVLVVLVIAARRSLFRETYFK